ncbi:MAG: LacI family DNA-binding transcriptional regulator [Cyclobacteriaceae bacterium]
MHHFITIKDIARELNVSVSTVSRALRDTYDVSLETKEKVLEKAKELKYKPNFNARGLSQGKTNHIGIIIPFITNYYFSTVITGIQKTAYNYGYNIILYVTNDSQEREYLITRNLTISGLDGILISTCASNYDHIHEIIDKGIPVVFFDRTNNLIATKVMQDDYNGAFEATSHLIEQGYSKIAHITGPKDQKFTQNRLNGYLDALTHYQIPIQNKRIIHSGFSQEYGERDMYKLLGSFSRPDAIFAVNDRKAIGAMLTLKSQKIPIGKEIGVVGFTNDPICTIISPSLTTVSESAFDIGRISCELLLQHIQKHNLPCKEVVLPGELIIRESSIRKMD